MRAEIELHVDASPSVAFQPLEDSMSVGRLHLVLPGRYENVNGLSKSLITVCTPAFGSFCACNANWTVSAIAKTSAVKLRQNISRIIPSSPC